MGWRLVCGWVYCLLMEQVRWFRNAFLFACALFICELSYAETLQSARKEQDALISMTTRITDSWRRPVGFKGGLEAYIRMVLSSNGEIVDARIAKTSGDVLFDRSTVNAVLRAGPFIEVASFDAKVFEEKFRTLTIRFRPESDENTSPPLQNEKLEPRLLDDQASYNSAFQLIRKGEFEQAIDAMMAFTHQYPKSELLVDAIFWVGQVESVLGKNSQAMETFGYIAKTFPDYRRILQVQVKLGKLLIESGRLNEGLSVLGKVIDLAPSSVEAGLADREIKKTGSSNSVFLLRVYDTTISQLPSPEWIETNSSTLSNSVRQKPELDDQRNVAIESGEIEVLKERLAKLEAEKIAAQQSISQDTQSPSILINTNSDGARGTISGTATDNTGIAEVLVDGQAVPIDSSGRFSTSTFIPSGGIDVQITAYDLKGLSTTETVRLERSKRTQTVSRLAAVNPLLGPKQKTSRDRVALIIGVEDYARAPSADFASGDAQMFADYAREKLGVADNNIKVLSDTGASKAEILRALKVWLPKAVKPDTTDLYVFYAGHGMPTADGTSAYLVPYDGDTQLLEDTAISRKRFFDEISATSPRSATFFFDNCFSGATRSEELLLASRPLGIKVKETSIPDNYLVFTAGETDQIAGVEPEVQHGRFSYFVFKGLEGEADANSDGKISAGELHTYVRESVGRFSAGAQTPTMLGDGNRWVLR